MRLLQFVGRACVLLVLFVVPTAGFVKSSRMFEHPVKPGPWHPTPPLLIFANRGNIGWATHDHKPTPDELKYLYFFGVLPYTPPPTHPPAAPATAPPTPIRPSLGAMPKTGWALDNGALITTDNNDVLILRPLTYGRPSLPGQGKGWRGAYWQPARTKRWQNYTLGVTVTNLGGQGFGGNATVVVGYAITRAGYAVSISAGRITIQNPSGAHIYSGVIHSATSHRVVVKLTNRLGVAVDGASIASLPVGHVQGGMGFGVWKAASSQQPAVLHRPASQTVGTTRMIKRIAPIALVLVLGAVATGSFLNGGGKSATATPSTPVAGALPWYAPYVDASLTMPKFSSRQVVLSFITGNGCAPTWNGTPLAQATAINTRIQQTQALSDQVIASFGGKAGPEPAVNCSDPTQLAASYKDVVTRYNLSTIDLDIEGSASLNSIVNARRAVAIASVQKAQARAGRGLAVWLTLAVTPSGLLPDSLAIVQQMLSAGVTISGVNVMTFDYGPLGGQTVLSASESALTSTAAQIQSLGLNSWSELGATIMEGRTDTAGQVWNLSDGEAFRNFAYTHRLGRLSEWSLLRDQQCSGTPRQPSNSCSGVTQQLQQFSQIFGNQAAPKLSSLSKHTERT